jgi:hypothetical protein
MLRKIAIGIALIIGLSPAITFADEGRYGGHTLEFGVRDSDFAADYVSMLQSDLSKLGYDAYLLTVGKLENSFGPMTEAAVKAFQRDYGVRVDGVVGEETAAAITRALAGEKPTTTEPFELSLLESGQVTVKAGKKGKYELKPEPGKTYVLSCEGDVYECSVVNPYDAYASTTPAPADVRFTLKEAGDGGEAVIFDDIPFAGKYYVEIEAINDLKDTPVMVRIYELTR